MIIPMKPENVRITLQLTSADFAAGEFAHDIDLQKLYENRNSCAYEFAIDYGGQIITNAYQLFYDDGTLYAAVFFTSNDGGTVKLTLSAGEGTIATSSTDLPSVSGSDNGKVLTVVEGVWGAADPVGDLPAVTSADEGDVLTVNGSGEWVNAEPASQLPTVTSSDEGDVLTVNGSGEWVNAEPASQLPTVTGSDNGKVLTVLNGAWGAAVPIEEVTVSDTGSVTQALDPGKLYHYTGALTALTLSLNSPAAGEIAHYHFDFISGATAPTLTLPVSVKMPDNFSVAINTRYEVDILNDYGAVVTWAAS